MDVHLPTEDKKKGSTRSGDDETLPPSKRVKVESDDQQEDGGGGITFDVITTEAKGGRQEPGESGYIIEDLLPPSRSLLPSAKLVERPSNQLNLTFEADVGITEYVSSDVPPLRGIIKQRFTDFLVFEIDQQNNVVRLQNIAKPDEPVSPRSEEKNTSAPDVPVDNGAITDGDIRLGTGAESLAKPVADPASSSTPMLTDDITSPADGTLVKTETVDVSESEDNKAWPARFTSRLSQYLSSEAIEKLKEMFLAGPVPLPAPVDDPIARPPPTPIPIPTSHPARPVPDGREAGGRGGRGDRESKGGWGGAAGRERPKAKHQDHRKVVSDPMPNKSDRTVLHQTIRELFEGRLESELEPAKEDDAPRIAIRWNQRPPRNRWSNKPKRNPRDPQDASKEYIHFTMQKANRDTQDALAHVSRMLKCSTKDLGTAGTKDKRGVTVQRVSLKRGRRTLGEVWKAVNNIPARRSFVNVTAIRGERGVRIGDLAYRKVPLELGHLKGNAFIITLRNVKESEEVINRAMQSMKENGFINYFGMQRFGTSPIPTHSIGLALLKSDWRRALSIILRPRPGETAEAEAGRRAWLEERNLGKALQLMPRRMVAERCILEAYQKNFNSDSDMQNALHAIPKNLRTMYVHAYQSYVWNAIVSERIARYGFNPIVGDLVFDKASLGGNKLKKEDDASDEESAPLNEEMDIDQVGLPEEGSRTSQSDTKKKHLTVKTKHLTKDDLADHTIFDVIMPLPGFDVTYPSGELGEKYRAFMKLDGLDPDNMTRERKDYSLSGAYRKIMHLPKEVSWKILRYTDPEVPLAQTDEDGILGLDQPSPQADGKFVALQIQLHLGSAVYATMALREVTQAETSSHYQSVLTQEAEDQEHRGSGEAPAAPETSHVKDA